MKATRLVAACMSVSGGMPDHEQPERSGRGAARRTLTLAVVFGLVSVPWTFGFEHVAGLPLWPSFIASAAVFAAGGGGPGLGRALASVVSGVLYATLTLWAVSWLGPGALTLSLAVGGAMFLASLNPLVPGLGFGPGAFLGYATLFSVHAAGVALVGEGVVGGSMATVASMVIGAGIAFVAEAVAAWFSPRAGAPAA